MKKLLLVTLIAVVQIAFAQKTKFSPDVSKSGSQLIEVIVQFKSTGNNNGNNGNNNGNNGNNNGNNGNNNGKNGNGGNNNGNDDQGDYDNNVNQVGQDGEIRTKLPKINAVHMKLSLQALQALQANPSVAYITPNRKLKRTLDISTQAVKANSAWSFGVDCTGVGVALVDSGITPKHDLTRAAGNSRIVYSQSFISGVSDPSDAYGHGTHVAGIIGSRGIDSTGPSFSRTFKGVAPGVNLINLRVLDQDGEGQEADVINAIQTAINLKNTYNIRVINLSLGRPVFESYTLDPLCQAAEAAWKAGIVVVTAAGNYGRDNSVDEHGYGTIVAPGNDPYVITVGAMNDMGTATRSDDRMASYSSKGPTAIDHIVKPDLVAPGNGIVSLMAPKSTLAANYSSDLVPNS